MEKDLEELRERLNLLIIAEDIVLYSGEILRLSQELDKFISASYYIEGRVA